jgi:hypothetical protein
LSERAVQRERGVKARRLDSEELHLAHVLPTYINGGLREEEKRLAVLQG